MNQDQALRDHLIWLIEEGGAHVTFDRAIDGIPPELRGEHPPNVPHTPWRLLEHLRICQWDILEFSRNSRHVSPDFPEGYWPEADGPPDDAAWQNSIAAFRDDQRQMIELIRDPRTDLSAQIPHGDGQTVLREALLVADHNAYHVGQLIAVRRALDCWPE